MPVRSRRSMKIRPPWSRRRWTQPATRASESTRSASTWPHQVSRYPFGAQWRRLAHASPPVISSTRLPVSTVRCSPVLHVAQLRGAVGLEDEDAAGADPVGVLELALEAAAGEVELGREAGVAQLDGQRHRPLALARVGDRDEGVAAARLAPPRPSASRIRSIPAAQPTAGVAGPPSCSIRPS